MTARPAIPEKVRRIVPLLGSPNEGEALGACRALARVLAGSGLDFGDLAAALPIGPEMSTADHPPAAPSRAPAPSYQDWRGEWAGRFRRPRTFTPRQEARQEAMAAFCRAHGTRLGPRERAFVGSIRPCLDGLTTLQADWLNDICARLEWEDTRQWQ